MLKWLEIDQDNQHMKFSALSADFHSPRLDLLNSRRPAHASVKGVPPKSGYFTAISPSSMRNIADRHRHAAYHEKPSDALFSDVNVDDLE